MKNLLVATACLVVPMGVLSAPAAAQEADFSGERITMTVPYGQGGGTDVWARFVAPNLQRFLPGAPTIVIENVPGGGSILGANQFAMTATSDGLSIMGVSSSTQIPFVLGDSRVRYDYADWTPIFVSPSGAVCYAQPGLGVDSGADIAALRDMTVRFGSQGPTSNDLVFLLALNLFDLDVNAVHGMKSRGEGRLGFERGEFDIDCQGASAYFANPLAEQGKAVLLFSLGILGPDGAIIRDPSFPDVPTLLEVYEQVEGSAPDGAAWDAYRSLWGAAYAGQKIVVIPKDVPPEVAAAYAAAAEAMAADPEFQQAAALEIGAYPQAAGEDAVALVEGALTVSDEAREWLRNWLVENHSVRFD